MTRYIRANDPREAARQAKAIAVSGSTDEQFISTIATVIKEQKIELKSILDLGCGEGSWNLKVQK